MRFGRRASCCASRPSLDVDFVGLKHVHVVLLVLDPDLPGLQGPVHVRWQLEGHYGPGLVVTCATGNAKSGHQISEMALAAALSPSFEWRTLLFTDG